MSKYCPMCDEVTNCTDNCKYCLEEQAEEEKTMKTLTLNAWGKSHKISFQLANYADNGNLYVGMICHDDEYPEPWSDLTVNLGNRLTSNCAYIDTNNNGSGIIDWLIANNLGCLSRGLGFSGFCTYPQFIFNLPELIKYVTIDKREVK